MKKIAQNALIGLLFVSGRGEVSKQTAYSFEEVVGEKWYLRKEIVTQHEIRVAKTFPKNSASPINTVIGYKETVWRTCHVPVEASRYRQAFNREATLPNGIRVFWNAFN